MGRAAHRLKGAASTMGARAMTAICLDLESLGRSGSTIGSVELIARLEEEFERVGKALRKELERRSKRRKTA